MIFTPAEKRHFVCYLSLGLLSLSLLTECDKVKVVGPSRCSGRVEVYHSDSWGTVCDDQWSTANAEVVCRELDCGTVLEAKKGAFFGEGKDQIWLDDVQCTGRESSVLKCEHRPFGQNNCGHGEDAGVVCSEHVRVVNGSNRCNGRLEVYHEGHWKRICSSDWGKAEADVVCQEINCGIAVTPTDDLHFGEALNMVGVKTSCFGNESSISQCKFQELQDSCVDATVSCANSKPIRLMNGTNRCNGRVELFHDGQWGTVCDDRWGMQEAAVVCREMNCGNALSVKYNAFFGRGRDQVWLDDVECSGHEKSLADCPHRGLGEHDCDHNEDAGVVCSASVRLYNGTNRCSGRVEVSQGGQWGKICNNNWGHQESERLCKELGCGPPKNSDENFHHGDARLKGYRTTCARNVSSISDCTFQEITGTCEGVSLSCTDIPPIRLVNGTDRCSGRVEVMNDGQWGTVCDDEWDLRDAEVVCRVIDCGTAQMAKTSAFFGPGQGDIWLDDVGCFGNETSLMHCRHPTLGENNCGHGEDAGVVCSANIRLINGTSQCSGRVEFSHGDHWSTAFNFNWGMNEATVVCREMNCGDPVKFTGSYGQSGAQRGYKVSCSGRESSLSQCRLTEYVRNRNDRMEEAAVECSGNVRLSGGHSRCAGRVEYYDKGQWGSVCGESWDMNDAAVVCRQLDCGRGHKITTIAEYGSGTGQTWIDLIECNGLESTLAQCPQRPFRDRTCNTTSVAGVVCTGSLEARLVNSKDECSGRVEVRHGDVWQTVCDTDWTLSKAQVVCDQLECGTALNAPGAAHFGQGSGSVVEASESCFRNTTFLQQCSANGFRSSSCGHDHDAGVQCAAQIRLASGASQCSGRVEVFYKSQWGTVCDDEWEMANGDVVCRQLGCGHAVSTPTNAHFGRGSGPIWLDNVECTGQESALSHCHHNGFGENNCGHGEDAGVICLGALEKPQITFSPAADVKWGEKVEITCTVVSEHLGGTFILRKMEGNFQMEKYSEHEAATFVFPSVEFSQKGSYYCEYQKKLPNQVIYYPQGNVAELSITVKMDIPRISLTSPHAMVIYSPDKISVNEGSSFSVTCSTHSIYSGGYFYLRKSNMTVTEAKPAFGHSIFYLATFDFPSLQHEHQGEYSCVFGLNISSMSFCSVPSKSLQVNVIAASSSSTVTGVVIGLLLVLLVLGGGYWFWRKRGLGAGTLVQFSNRFGGAITNDVDDRSNRVFEESTRTTQVNENVYSRSPVEKKADADLDNSVERVPEDLAGRVCYELEPLVLS
ncbi:deleted in malignant brain tumors 1 protein-like isoform X1 [Acanthopagrus latus]|uniref:deleted in malignant brain tumors 1 protein-like isoform X1 n=1 Tax=Acanthopagrus latus TaxID=8177 RepID=UPI00187C0E6D|nr:deleted in malignant brain tumors 1 protein-like isoform X1 [Acanthopagrus latus]XP_036941412.1 deleted in malignant brain tumors 1 protein-like isoform X1 [Acanthopagrus latus]